MTEQEKQDLADIEEAKELFEAECEAIHPGIAHDEWSKNVLRETFDKDAEKAQIEGW